MDRFDVLAARKANGSLSVEESRELEALVQQYPKLGERLIELEEMETLLMEFSPLLESMEEAPAAQFPEHRMGQFTSAVWKEFRHQVPQRKEFNLWQLLMRHSFALCTACAVLALVISTVARRPERIVIASTNGEAATQIIEFGVYNPVTEMDYAPEQLLSLLNVDTRTFLSGVEKLNTLAATPVIKPLSFEMADAFEQWKGDDMNKETVARVWVDPNMERLYIMQRQGGRLEQTVRELPRDSSERDQLIRSTIQNLSQHAVGAKGSTRVVLPNENA